MAIVKTDAVVENMRVLDDGSVEATVNYELSDNGTSPATTVTRVRAEVPVSDATDAEKTAAASLVSKAAALAIA
jgi:hypothetical protein